MIKINSETAEVCFSTKAAEITSFKKKDSPEEYMWQGDPAFWAGRNPILFPIVGNTYSKKYEIAGKTYSMGNHGLARHLDFTVSKQQADQLTMEVSSDESTRKLYPFDWQLTVNYHLVDTKLIISYQVSNLSTVKMPFTFGLHPAFNVPIGEGSFSDYRLEFAKEEKPKQLLIDGSKQDCPAFSTIKLDYGIFKKYHTLMYEGLKSDYLCLTDGQKGIEVGISGFPYLAFWCGDSFPFLCIEPWYGLGDFTENQLKFAERPGMMELAVSGVFKTEYYIKLL